MNTLKLFNAQWIQDGDVFRYADQGSIEILPGTELKLIETSSAVKWLRAHIVAQWQGGQRIDFALMVPIELIAEQWQISEAKSICIQRFWIGDSRVPVDTLRVGLGPIEFFTSNVVAQKVSQDLSIVSYDGQANAVVLLDAPNEEHPLTVITDRVTISINLPQAYLQFGEGSFRAKVATSYQTPHTGIRALHRTELWSCPLDVCLDNQNEELTLHLKPPQHAGPDEKRLFLNLELDARDTYIGAKVEQEEEGEKPLYNGIVPALELKDYNLTFKLHRTNRLFRPQLSELKVEPSKESAHARFSVLCYTATDEWGETFSLYGTKAQLRVRVGSPEIRDNTNLPGFVLDEMQAITELPVQLPKEIHGTVPGIWGHIRQAKGLELKGNHAVYSSEVAELLQRDLDTLPKVPDTVIHSDVLCYESLPSLIRKMNADLDLQAEFEMSLKELTPELTNPVVDPLHFKGTFFEWPMIDIDRLRRRNWLLSEGAENPMRKRLDALNQRMARDDGPKATMVTERHSTRVDVGPNDDDKRSLNEIVPTDPPTEITKDLVRPVLKDHGIVLDFHNVRFSLGVFREGVPDNPTPSTIGLMKGELFEGFIPNQFENPNTPDWFRIPFDNESVGSRYVDSFQQLLALLKFEVGKPLMQVIDELPPERDGLRSFMLQLIEGGPDEFGIDHKGGVIDEEILEPGWTGMILLRPGFLFQIPGLNNLLTKFVGLPMRYLALSARIDGDDPNYSNIYGTYQYFDPEEPDLADDTDDEPDVLWDLNLVDIRFRDREIVHFEVNGILYIRKFWKTSVDSQDPGPEPFKIIGRYQAASAENNPTGQPRIVFEATRKDPVSVKVDLAMIKQVEFKGVTVFLEGIDASSGKHSNSRFELEGDIRLQEKSWGMDKFLSIDPDEPIKFKHLGLPLPSEGFQLNWDWPSLEFPLKQKKPLNLGPISFTFTHIGLGEHEVVDNAIRIYPIHDPELSGKFPWVAMEVELFKYPALSQNAGKSIGFELIAAIASDGSTGGIWIRGLDFENLEIDLFRFMKISVEKVDIFDEDDPNVKGLWLRSVSVEILGKKLIDDLSAIIFEQEGKRSFAGYIPFEEDDDSDGISIHPVVKIDWVLLCNNVVLGELAPLLLTLKGTGNKELLDAIEKKCKQGKLGGQAVPGKWGFAIGFSILEEALRAKLLFVDGGAVGLMIESEALKEFFGFEGFAIAYIKGRTPDEDHFWTEFRVPSVNTGAFNFLGGTLSIEVYLNGGFMLDVGFPWLNNGIRRWDRGLGFNVGIYVGHAGFYVRYTHGALPSGGQHVTLAGGFGLSVGYGRDFEFAEGRLKVSVSIELYGILEGSISFQSAPEVFVEDRNLSAEDFQRIDRALDYDEESQILSLDPTGSEDDSRSMTDRAYHSGNDSIVHAVSALSVAKSKLHLQRVDLKGIIGIIVKGYGEIDVWVLYAKVEVVAFAEAETKLTWQRGQRSQLTYTFRVGQTFSASCRVGSGWLSYTFEFSVYETMEFSGTIDL